MTKFGQLWGAVSDGEQRERPLARALEARLEDERHAHSAAEAELLQERAATGQLLNALSHAEARHAAERQAWEVRALEMTLCTRACKRPWAFLFLVVDGIS